jgi:hypothetical protein
MFGRDIYALLLRLLVLVFLTAGEVLFLSLSLSFGNARLLLLLKVGLALLHDLINFLLVLLVSLLLVLFRLVCRLPLGSLGLALGALAGVYLVLYLVLLLS